MRINIVECARTHGGHRIQRPVALFDGQKDYLGSAVFNPDGGGVFIAERVAPPRSGAPTVPSALL